LKRLGVFLNLICSAAALFLPIALYLKTGTIKYSYSVYHGTEATYILLISLLLLGISYLISDNIISGLLLIGVALFNTFDFEWTHNAFAAGFFIYTTYSIFKDKRFNYLAIPVVSAAFLIPAITLFWFETIAVGFFVMHSILYSIKKLKIYKQT
tara:strand:+ start:983 stop:1444 length:462 start_codon:yes stop_codon:yes gene_type:complete